MVSRQGNGRAGGMSPADDQRYEPQLPEPGRALCRSITDQRERREEQRHREAESEETTHGCGTPMPPVNMTSSTVAAPMMMTATIVHGMVMRRMAPS